MLYGMNLSQYFEASERGQQSKLAAALKISQVLISQWASGIRPIPVHRCPDIERETNGVVRCEDLRPDVDWAVVRGRPIAAPAGAERCRCDDRESPT